MVGKTDDVDWVVVVVFEEFRTRMRGDLKTEPLRPFPTNISISDLNTTDVSCALTPSFPFESRSVLPTRWSMNLADRHRLLV